MSVKRLTFIEQSYTANRSLNCERCPMLTKCNCASDCVDSAVNRLAYIEDILGDDYDISRLRDLVQADRDRRCFISDVKLGDEAFYIPKYNGKALSGIRRGHVQAVSFTKAGKRVRLREYHEYNKDFMLGKTAFTTLEAAEEALKGQS